MESKQGGKRFRRSLKTKDCDLAKQRFREQETKVKRLDGTEVERNMLFEDLPQRWLSSASRAPGQR